MASEQMHIMYVPLNHKLHRIFSIQLPCSGSTELAEAYFSASSSAEGHSRMFSDAGINHLPDDEH